MHALKILLKLIGITGVLFGGYEIGEIVASGRVTETANMLGNEFNQLKQHFVQQAIDVKNSLNVLQLSTIVLIGVIGTVFLIGMIVWIIKSTKSCISKSVGDAVEAK